MPDPILVQATKEIESILHKYDIAGAFVLQSKSNLHYMYSVTPSWSCLSIQEDGLCRFQSKAKTGPPEEKQKMEWTVGMIMAFHNFGERMRDDFEKVAMAVGEKIEHITTRMTEE